MRLKLPGIKSFILFSCCMLLSSAGVLAQGDLMILPKRLVFDGNERSKEINLVNTGSETATYGISLINYRMTEEGDFQEVTVPDEGQRFADGFLRFYPRQVTLGPREAQTVRIQVTRTGNMTPGEYRSHIYFRAIEDQTALGTETQQEDQDGISINIRAVFGISIPTIIRNGQSTTSVELSDLNLDTTGDTPVLTTTINRTGNMSVYGALEVVHMAPGGTSTVVGGVKGLSVYTPNARRIFSLPLQAEGINFNTGKLIVTYQDEGSAISDSEELKLEG